MQSNRARPRRRAPAADPALSVPGFVAAARVLLEDALSGFAITEGPAHTVAWANPAFRRIADSGEGALEGRRLTDICRAPVLPALLDHVLQDSDAMADELLVSSHGRVAWLCSAWPLLDAGARSCGTMVELRLAAPAGVSGVLRRQVAERLLLSALREMDAAAAADAARRRSEFLERSGREISASVDEPTTRAAVAELKLPGATTWCIVDVVDSTGGLCRLAIVHPDPTRQPAARALRDVWSPEPGDPFGAGAIDDADHPLAIITDVDTAVEQAAHGDDNLAALRELGIGSVLTVPMRVGEHLIGAITFIGAPRDQTFQAEEIEVAEALALQSGLALDNARHYAEALEFAARAQEGSRAKTEFLAHMSHELRTPLNAIAGFVDIIDLGIHGPVTDAQRQDLERIRASQRRLLAMINDILNFMQINRGRVEVRPVDVPLHDVLRDALDLIAPLAQARNIDLPDARCAGDVSLRADPDRLQQILINLLTNAVKFTPHHGQVHVECAVGDSMVGITIVDNGIGIPADRLEAVFEPFVQVVTGLADRAGGVGLGLAISRELARAMGGDITVESTPDVGSRFMLELPLVLPAGGAPVA